MKRWQAIYFYIGLFTITCCLIIANVVWHATRKVNPKQQTLSTEDAGLIAQAFFRPFVEASGDTLTRAKVLSASDDKEGKTLLIKIVTDRGVSANWLVIIRNGWHVVGIPRRVD